MNVILKNKIYKRVNFEIIRVSFADIRVIKIDDTIKFRSQA